MFSHKYGKTVKHFKGDHNNLFIIPINEAVKQACLSIGF